MTKDEYIGEAVMNMDRDAQGLLLQLVPIALRINIYIVNIDTSGSANVII